MSNPSALLVQQLTNMQPTGPCRTAFLLSELDRTAADGHCHDLPCPRLVSHTPTQTQTAPRSELGLPGTHDSHQLDRRSGTWAAVGVHTCAKAGRRRRSRRQQQARAPNGRSVPTAAAGGVLRWEPRTWKLPPQLLWACCLRAAPDPAQDNQTVVIRSRHHSPAFSLPGGIFFRAGVGPGVQGLSDTAGRASLMHRGWAGAAMPAHVLSSCGFRVQNPEPHSPLTPKACLPPLPQAACTLQRAASPQCSTAHPGAPPNGGGPHHMLPCSSHVQQTQQGNAAWLHTSSCHLLGTPDMRDLDATLPCSCPAQTSRHSQQQRSPFTLDPVSSHIHFPAALLIPFSSSVSQATLILNAIRHTRVHT